MYTQLPTRGLIALSGDDTIELLQGIVSNDVRPVSKGQIVYTALLSPQGKFLHDMFLVPWAECVLIDCDGARANDLMARLKMYRLRSKVEIMARTDSVFAVWNIAALPSDNDSIAVHRDPRLPALGWRVMGDAGAVNEWLQGKAISRVNEIAYDRMRIKLGIPEGGRDMIVDKSLLLEFGFEQLHGVDFNKGCYVGQEVTARSKFRGQVRKGLFIVRGAKPLPASATPITSDGKPIGELRSSEGDVGLAILQIEEAEKKLPLHAGDIAIEVSRPSWM